MSIPFVQYEPQDLISWDTERLGNLYINSFTKKQREDDEKEKLKVITEVLVRRPLNDLKKIKVKIIGMIEVLGDSKYSSSSGRILQMGRHFDDEILDKVQEFQKMPGYSFLNLAESPSQRAYIHSFLEDQVSSSDETKKNLEIYASAILSHHKVPSERNRLGEKMENALKRRVEKELYEECSILRDLIRSYELDIVSETIIDPRMLR